MPNGRGARRLCGAWINGTVFPADQVVKVQDFE